MSFFIASLLFFLFFFCFLEVSLKILILKFPVRLSWMMEHLIRPLLWRRARASLNSAPSIFGLFDVSRGAWYCCSCVVELRTLVVLLGVLDIDCIISCSTPLPPEAGCTT